jgi:hypothetical protein
MKAEFDRVIVERTGFGPGARVPEFVARVWRRDPACLEWAYGETERDAYANCMTDTSVIHLNALEALVSE